MATRSAFSLAISALTIAGGLVLIVDGLANIKQQLAAAGDEGENDRG